jgi:hypothetical protein
MIAAVTLALLCLTACSEQMLHAVTGHSCKERPEPSVCARESWPNEYSGTNSDAWLVAHGDALREMRPHVLVLDFHNPLSIEQMRDVANVQIAALAEGSRYHGYADPAAPPFLNYEVFDIVDLRDATPPAGWTFSSSSLIPLDDAGAFDVAALFTQPYTDRMAVVDPDEPTRHLDLCEQFERGVIHELWLAVGDDAPGREPKPMIECKPMRDADSQRAEGPIVGTVQDELCASLPACGVTMRIAHLSPLRGVGCDLLVRGWAIYGSMRAIPYLERNGARFFNADLDTRYGAPVASLLELCASDDVPCLNYPSATSLESALPQGPAFRIDNYGQGCGSPEFPANASFMWDWENAREVQTRCEHYGLGDGSNGQDLPSSYSFSRVSSLVPDYPDCGGPWQIYWRQNIPGLANRARDLEGAPMKNWWPFLFY